MKEVVAKLVTIPALIKCAYTVKDFHSKVQLTLWIIQLYESSCTIKKSDFKQQYGNPSPALTNVRTDLL